MSKKLTIGLVLDDTLDRADGVQQAVIAIGEKLRSRGHDVHYIVSKTERTDLKNVHSVGSYLSVKFNGNSVRTPWPASKKRIKQLLDDISFDVLHVMMPYSPLLAAKVLKRAPESARKIGTFHILPYNFMATYGTKLLGLVMKRSINSLDHCFAVSGSARQFMDSMFKTGHKSSVLPNPVDYSFFHGFKRQKQSKKHVVFVGRFEERKGVRELIDAYAALPNDLRATTKLTMISKGPLHTQMIDKAKKLDLDIHFPGFVSEEEKAQTLANADVAVYPSTSGESFGIVLTEAMSAGAGVTIGGNNPGYASVLGAWPETLFDPKDTAGFADILQKYLTDDRLREEIGAKQHEAVKQYDIERVADELERMYKGS